MDALVYTVGGEFLAHDISGPYQTTDKRKCYKSHGYSILVEPTIDRGGYLPSGEIQGIYFYPHNTVWGEITVIDKIEYIDTESD